MARVNFGREGKQSSIFGGGKCRPVFCLLAILPLLAACGALLDAAGFERISNRESVAAPPSDPSPTRQSRKNQGGLVKSAEVVELQGMLNALGYEAGPADGFMGPRTKASIRQFQSDTRLPADGRLSRELIAALRRNYDEIHSETPAGDGDANAPPQPKLTRGSNAVAEPDYEIGDRYVYSDGRIETAVGINGGLIDWQVNDGSQYTAPRNFIIPPVKRETAGGATASSLDSSSDVNWPPAATNEMVQVTKPGKRSAGPVSYSALSGEWRCGVGGRSDMEVPAGRFDVVKISCEKTGRAQGEWRRQVWYYAPDIRHFVRREETANANQIPAVTELVAVQPGRGNWSQSARSGFNWAIQKLLDRGATGSSIEWKVRDSGIEFDITLTGRIDAAGDISCRRYTLVRTRPASPRMYPALACRKGVGGRWKIPNPENGLILPTGLLASR